MPRRRKSNLPRTPDQMIRWLTKMYTDSPKYGNGYRDQMLLVHRANVYDRCFLAGGDHGWRAFRLRAEAFEHDLVYQIRHRASGLVLTASQVSIEGCRRDINIWHGHRHYLPNNGKDVYVVSSWGLGSHNGRIASEAGEALAVAAGLTPVPSLSGYYMIPHADVDLVTVRKHPEVVDVGPVLLRPNTFV